MLRMFVSITRGQQHTHIHTFQIEGEYNCSTLYMTLCRHGGFLVKYSSNHFNMSVFYMQACSSESHFIRNYSFQPLFNVNRYTYTLNLRSIVRYQGRSYMGHSGCKWNLLTSTTLSIIFSAAWSIRELLPIKLCIVYIHFIWKYERNLFYFLQASSVGTYTLLKFNRMSRSFVPSSAIILQYTNARM